jgi:HAD superfamily hydrolase (TIGR01509 family)
MVEIAPCVDVVLLDWGNTLMEDPGTPGAMAFWPEVKAVDGARQLLDRLKAANKTLCVATNGDVSDARLCRQALARVGFDGYFTRIFSSKDIGCAKPDPAFFQQVLASLSISADRVAMIGDSFANDVAGPNAVGIRAIWFNRKNDQRRSGPLFETVFSLEELRC